MFNSSTPSFFEADGWMLAELDASGVSAVLCTSGVVVEANDGRGTARRTLDSESGTG